MSHRAVTLTFGPARRASPTAPLPRPPHPTSPTLRTSDPAARTAGAGSVAAAAVAAVAFRKLRRDGGVAVIGGRLGGKGWRGGFDAIILRDRGGRVTGEIGSGSRRTRSVSDGVRLHPVAN